MNFLLHTLGFLALLHSCIALEDVVFSWAKENWYNPSLVQYDNKTICAAKLTVTKHVEGTSFWINTIFMCEGGRHVSDNLKCREWDPWSGEYADCILPQEGSKNGKTDSIGLGDTKVFVWPGKGVYAIFGRKPKSRGLNKQLKYCKEGLVYQQVLAQVKEDPEQDKSDPWYLLEPVPLLVSHGYQPGWAREKNWMPFAYKQTGAADKLYVVYSVMPHAVYQIHPNGTSVREFVTEDPVMFAKFAGHDVHGGPPIVYVGAQHSASGLPYYLGILHFYARLEESKVKVYRHFAYKFEAQPPFKVLAISDELPVVFRKDTTHRRRFIAFVAGLFLSDDGTVSITYGSADSQARVMQLKVQELEAMFTGEVRFIQHINTAASIKKKLKIKKRRMRQLALKN